MKQWTAARHFGEGREIETSFGEVDGKERQQHRDAAQKRVEEKLRRRPIPSCHRRAAPDFYKEEPGNQTHFIEEKPENEILGGEVSVEGRLHHEQESVGAARHSAREES